MNLLPLVCSCFLLFASMAFSGEDSSNSRQERSEILSHVVNPSSGNLRTYYLDSEGNQFNSFGALRQELEKNGQVLDFAMNGGMYMEDRRPLGLYVESGREIRPLNKRESGHGNFYLQPNGVLMIYEDDRVEVCTSNEYDSEGAVEYATQSGPMLLIEGHIHPSLTEGSSNVHIRNGVGVLPSGEVIFAMSRELINFYDFARFFKEMGCANALYLDGFVSRTYLPQKDVDYLGGNFGVIIAESH